MGEIPERASFLREDQEDTPRNKFLEIRELISPLAVLDCGMVVYREWLDQFEGVEHSKQAIEDHTGEFIYSNLLRWEAQQSIEYKCHVATLDYLATGEGRALRVIGGIAQSIGHFVLSLDKQVDLYFVQGLRFFDGVPPEDDVAFATLGSDYIKKLITESAHVSFDLQSHVNYS